jgi:hypothetical protein
LIHLIKLAVGVRDVAHLAALQAARSETDPPLRHRTRNSPKRAEELRAGGSIYWVIGGVILVRQNLLDVIEDRWDDGTRCAGLVLDPVLVRVQARAVKAFQGWRYLEPADAPADITADSGTSGADIPEEMRRALAALALI